LLVLVLVLLPVAVVVVVVALWIILHVVAVVVQLFGHPTMTSFFGVALLGTITEVWVS
jgi:hypothetical protein